MREEAFKRGFIKAAMEVGLDEKTAKYYYSKHKAERGERQYPVAKEVDGRIYSPPEHLFDRDEDYSNWLQASKNSPERNLSSKETKHFQGSGDMPEYAKDLSVKDVPMSEYGFGGDGTIFKHIPMDTASAMGFDKQHAGQFDLEREKLLQMFKRILALR